MKPLIQFNTRKIAFIIAMLFVPLLTFSQEEMDKEYVEARKEIKEMFGEVPSFFEAYPDHALSGAWDYFKEINSPDNVIPPKYKQLMQLSVAAQIPCDYCVYYHTVSAKNHGATETEIQEAIAHGAETRHWSMVLQGNQVDLEEFKEEFQEMMEYMAKKNE